MTRSQQAGFTLLEAVAALAIMVPILGSILSINAMVNREISSSDQAALVSETGRRVGERLGQLARGGLLSTIQVKADASDVAAAEALALSIPGTHVPTLGEWISPPAGFARDNLSLQSAAGVETLNAAATTTARLFEFAMDATESANGKDDDGDGLIDEGKLLLTIDGKRVTLADGVERCLFSLDGRILTVDLRCGRSNSRREAYRATSQHKIYLRNN
ncbi:MAG: hypothetical protein R3F56_16545 [Planctomycetota bacterium]